MTRKAISKDEKLASALLELQRLRGDPIDRESAKAMTAAQIVSLFQFDHDAGYVAHGADNHPTGLTPLLISEHREKTRKDKGIIAKCARVSKAHEAFRSRLLSKQNGDGEEMVKGRRKKGGATLRSRGFDKSKRKLMSGKVVER